MLIAFTREFLIGGLTEIAEAMDPGDPKVELSRHIYHLKAGHYDAAFSGPPFPDTRADAKPMECRIDTPPSITIPPGYEVVIRKAER